MNVGADTVHRVISRALTSVTKEPAEELLTFELGRCDVLLAEAMQTVKAFHPLVSGGRVVSAPMLNNQGEPIRNPESGDVLTRVLEDKAPKFATIHVATKLLERRAKYFGLEFWPRCAEPLPAGRDPYHRREKALRPKQAGHGRGAASGLSDA